MSERFAHLLNARRPSAACSGVETDIPLKRVEGHTRLMGRPRLLLAAVLAAAAVLVTPLSANAATIPTATSFDGTPTVGAIFRGSLADGHECSASVIASPGEDLIITAGHCVFGNPAGWKFVPGYDEGRTPYGVWTVTSAYVDPRWQKSENTKYDYAILRIAPRRIHGRTVRIQQVTGANLLGTAPRTGTTITDPAYNAGVDDQPITCTVPAYSTDGYPGFDCGNYQGGVSGSPLLSGHGKVRRGPRRDRRAAPGRLLRHDLVLVAVHDRGLRAARPRGAAREAGHRAAARLGRLLRPMA